ncbi:hypothetical protein [Kitasatospora sp. GP82]|nr:hypothetical protein [Kitasatospora sp. GP82]MDH6126849.1 hypothetical protein [Kitasatospora sp. GP82]
MLLTDPEDNILLLKASYRDSWLYPAGVIDHGEGRRSAPPGRCGRRPG